MAKRSGYSQQYFASRRAAMRNGIFIGSARRIARNRSRGIVPLTPPEQVTPKPKRTRAKRSLNTTMVNVDGINVQVPSNMRKSTLAKIRALPDGEQGIAVSAAMRAQARTAAHHARNAAKANQNGNDNTGGTTAAPNNGPAAPTGGTDNPPPPRRGIRSMGEAEEPPVQPTSRDARRAAAAATGRTISPAIANQPTAGTGPVNLDDVTGITPVTRTRIGGGFDSYNLTTGGQPNGYKLMGSWSGAAGTKPPIDQQRFSLTGPDGNEIASNIQLGNNPTSQIEGLIRNKNTTGGNGRERTAVTASTTPTPNQTATQPDLQVRSTNPTTSLANQLPQNNVDFTEGADTAQYSNKYIIKVLKPAAKNGDFDRNSLNNLLPQGKTYESVGQGLVDLANKMGSNVSDIQLGTYGGVGVSAGFDSTARQARFGKKDTDALRDAFATGDYTKPENLRAIHDAIHEFTHGKDPTLLHLEDKKNHADAYNFYHFNDQSPLHLEGPVEYQARQITEVVTGKRPNSNSYNGHVAVIENFVKHTPDGSFNNYWHQKNGEERQKTFNKTFDDSVKGHLIRAGFNNQQVDKVSNLLGDKWDAALAKQHVYINNVLTGSNKAVSDTTAQTKNRSDMAKMVNLLLKNHADNRKIKGALLVP